MDLPGLAQGAVEFVKRISDFPSITNEELHRIAPLMALLFYFFGAVEAFSESQQLDKDEQYNLTGTIFSTLWELDSAETGLLIIATEHQCSKHALAAELKTAGATNLLAFQSDEIPTSVYFDLDRILLELLNGKKSSVRQKELLYIYHHAPKEFHYFMRAFLELHP